MTRCRYCQSGRIAVEPGSSLTYPCPDCGGTGRQYVPDDVCPLDLERMYLDDFEPNESETKDT